MAPEVTTFGTNAVSLVARLDFFAFEIPPVRYRRKLFDAHGCSRLLGHWAELTSVRTIVCDLVRDDQMVFGIDGRLHVIANNARASGLHRVGIRIGQRYLFIRCFIESHLDFFELLHFYFQRCDLAI